MRELRNVLVAAMMVLAFSFGCSSEDTKDPVTDIKTEDKTVETDIPADKDVPVGEDVAEEDVPPAEKVNVTAVVTGFGTEQPTGAVTVEVMVNDTGKGTGLTFTSDADGIVVVEGLDKGKEYGFKCTKENHKETYQWNIKAQGDVQEEFFIVPNTIYQMALGLAGLTPEAGMGVVAGAIYWRDSDGNEEAIGGATVEVEEGDVRYMAPGNGLPTTLMDQACAAPGTTKGNGRYVVANLPPGRLTFTARDVDCNVVGSAVMWNFADTIAVSNIYANPEVETNPASDTCRDGAVENQNCPVDE